MKKIVLGLALILAWTVSAQAAVVYLKDGGTISARKVWREKGKVVVLVNKESITSFSPNEINLKKTFPPRRKLVKPAPTVTSAPASGVSSQGNAVPATAKSDNAGKKLSLPSLPTSLPQREAPKAAEEGTIRKQKRQMEERIAE